MPVGSEHMRVRLPFIDNIRWTMIILVLSMHASDTYSPFGNWYYTDRPSLSLGGRVFFATYQSFLQGFFMALLLFVSAYFAPASYDRKGAAQYVRDRFVRLILPTLLYIFAIGPLTEYYVSHSWTGGGGFGHQWLVHLPRVTASVAAGMLAASCAIWIFIVVFALARPSDAAELDGGLNLPSALRCLWEALVCVGMSCLLIILYRRHFNRGGRAERFLSQNAFAVYLFHPPILIACAILIHGLAMAGPAKAGLLTAIAAIAVFATSALVFRQIPYLRAVL